MFSSASLRCRRVHEFQVSANGFREHRDSGGYKIRLRSKLLRAGGKPGVAIAAPEIHFVCDSAPKVYVVRPTRSGSERPKTSVRSEPSPSSSSCAPIPALVGISNSSMLATGLIRGVGNGIGNARSRPGLIDPRHGLGEVEIGFEYGFHDPVEYRVGEGFPPGHGFIGRLMEFSVSLAANRSCNSMAGSGTGGSRETREGATGDQYPRRQCERHSYWTVLHPGESLGCLFETTKNYSTLQLTGNEKPFVQSACYVMARNR